MTGDNGKKLFCYEPKMSQIGPKFGQDVNEIEAKKSYWIYKQIEIECFFVDGEVVKSI